MPAYASFFCYNGLENLLKRKATKMNKIAVTIGLALITILIAGCEPGQPEGISLSTDIRQRPWETGLDEGIELTTSHYQIFTTAGDQKLERTLPGFMEACYINYNNLTELSAKPISPMPMYMLASREEWLNLTKSKFGSGAETAEKLEAGGYTYKGVTVCWNIGQVVTYSIAAHEGMHQFLYHRLKNKLPLWAEEGLATNSEGFVFDPGRVRFLWDNNVLRIVDLRQAILGDYWIPLEKLLVTSPAAEIKEREEKALGYYGQVWALVNFLRNDPTYSPRWQQMMKDAESGQFHKIFAHQRPAPGIRRPKALSRRIFEHYINQDINAFEAEYKTYCRKLVKLD